MKWFQLPRPEQFSSQERSSLRPASAEEPFAPDLIQKNQIRLGKLLLWAGLGLSILVILEMRQEMVKALVPDAAQTAQLPALSPAALPSVAAEPQRSNLPRARPTSPSSARQPTVQATVQPRAQPTVIDGLRPGFAHRASPIALNADTDTANQEQMSRVSPSQLAANVWAGSSFPVEDFQQYTSPFGYRSSATGRSGSEFHYGLDMAAPQGSYIRSWWTGKVVEVTDNTNCGTSVVIESGHWLHIYCHMQGQVERGSDGKRYLIDRNGGIQIWQDQELPAGARIGRVGMTGRTTGPHLHWGLKYDGNWVNPALVLRAMYAGQRAASGQ